MDLALSFILAGTGIYLYNQPDQTETWVPPILIVFAVLSGVFILSNLKSGFSAKYNALKSRILYSRLPVLALAIIGMFRQPAIAVILLFVFLCYGAILFAAGRIKVKTEI